MATNQLTLYVESRFLSPYAMSAFVALQEKGLAFAIRSLDLAARENYSAEYASTSFTCRVPMLRHGDFSLAESSAIAEYLDEAFPSPGYRAIFPGALRPRARARQIQAWLRSDFLAIRQERPTEVVFLKPSDQPLSDAARASANRLFAASDALLAKDATDLFGEWSIADTDLALMLNRLVMNGDAVPDRLAAYAQQQWQRPSVRQWIEQGSAASARRTLCQSP